MFHVKLWNPHWARYICDIPKIMEDYYIFICKECGNPHIIRASDHHDHRNLAVAIKLFGYDSLTCWLTRLCFTVDFLHKYMIKQYLTNLFYDRLDPSPLLRCFQTLIYHTSIHPRLYRNILYPSYCNAHRKARFFLYILKIFFYV